jgi:hypothetical protein
MELTSPRRFPIKLIKEEMMRGIPNKVPAILNIPANPT